MFFKVPFDILQLYGSIGIVCAMIIAIIRNRARTTSYKDTIDRRFCNLLLFFIAFSLVDAIWGLSGSDFIEHDSWLFILFTYGFHFMSAWSACMSSSYILNYMKIEGRAKAVLTVFRYALIVFQMLFLFMNIPFEYAFYFTWEKGVAIYNPCPLRYCMFYLQFLHFLPALLYAAYRLFVKKDPEKSYRHGSAAIFSLVPLLFGFLQMLFPDGAFYTLGFLLLAIVIYAFNVTNQREAFLESFYEAREAEKSRAAIQEALDKAEAANAAKTVFLSNMSHDIRTPINGVMGMVTIASREEMSDKARSCLGKIDSASKHLLSLINDVLDMSRIESGKTKIAQDPMDVRTLIDNCRSIILGQVEGRNIDFEWRLDELNNTRVLGDQLRIRQVLINILGNAVKFTPDGGSILFEAKELSCKNDTVRISFLVKDSGIGMTPEFLPHVFESFSQEDAGARGRYQGTGLGLAICKQMVELMGGSIEVESEYGKGSAFTVVLPFVIDRTEHRETAKVQIPENLDGIKVLLAEDNELNAEIAQTLLEESGLKVKIAENGRIALEAFANSKPGDYDVILMDIMMPEMNGYEATRAIRALERDDAKTIPIIAMTANAFDEDRRMALEAGMNAHLSKPVHFPSLLSTLSRLAR